MTTAATSTWLTPEEVAQELRVSHDTVLRAVKADRLKAFKDGRVVRISRDALDAYIARHSNGDQLGQRRRRRTA